MHFSRYADKQEAAQKRTFAEISLDSTLTELQTHSENTRAAKARLDDVNARIDDFGPERTRKQVGLGLLLL